MFSKMAAFTQTIVLANNVYLTDKSFDLFSDSNYSLFFNTVDKIKALTVRDKVFTWREATKL